MYALLKRTGWSSDLILFSNACAFISLNTTAKVTLTSLSSSIVLKLVLLSVFVFIWKRPSVTKHCDKRRKREMRNIKTFSYPNTWYKSKAAPSSPE